MRVYSSSPDDSTVVERVFYDNDDPPAPRWLRVLHAAAFVCLAAAVAVIFVLSIVVVGIIAAHVLP